MIAKVALRPSRSEAVSSKRYATAQAWPPVAIRPSSATSLPPTTRVTRASAAALAGTVGTCVFGDQWPLRDAAPMGRRSALRISSAARERTASRATVNTRGSAVAGRATRGDAQNALSCASIRTGWSFRIAAIAPISPGMELNRRVSSRPQRGGGSLPPARSITTSKPARLSSWLARRSIGPCGSAGSMARQSRWP